MPSLLPVLGAVGAVVQQLESLLARANKPLVLDADALNILAESRDLLNLLPRKYPLHRIPKRWNALRDIVLRASNGLEESEAIWQEGMAFM